MVLNVLKSNVHPGKLRTLNKAYADIWLRQFWTYLPVFIQPCLKTTCTIKQPFLDFLCEFMASNRFKIYEHLASTLG